VDGKEQGKKDYRKPFLPLFGCTLNEERKHLFGWAHVKKLSAQPCEESGRRASHMIK
jgi:hypothetical protein